MVLINGFLLGFGLYLGQYCCISMFKKIELKKKLKKESEEVEKAIDRTFDNYDKE